MFENTPKIVEGIVKKFPLWVRTPAIRYYASAQALVAFYVGRDVLGELNDDFLRFDKERIVGTNWEYLARVIHLAEVLFALRNEPGFNEICRRMTTRELGQVHSEVSAAAMLKCHDFTIYARRELSVQGEDFDFTIKGHGVEANVEVWASSQSKFDANALRRRLGDKRKQLPTDKPAILVCLFPEVWFDQIERLYDQFDALTERFFKGTSRINAVLFAHEEFATPTTIGGMLLLNGYAIPHDNPRHNSQLLRDSLIRGPHSHHAVTGFAQSPHGPATVQVQNEFYRWVNWLIDGKPVP